MIIHHDDQVILFILITHHHDQVTVYLDNSSSSIWNNKRVFVFSEVVTMARLMVSPDSNLFEFQIEKVKSGVLCFVVITQMTKIA